MFGFEMDAHGDAGEVRAWNGNELRILIAAYKREFECWRDFQTYSGRRRDGGRGRQMSRGQEIAHFLLSEGANGPVRDEGSCGKTWELLEMDFWDIYDHDRSGCVGLVSYFDMTPAERRRNPYLPRVAFPRDLYDEMLTWVPKKRELQRERWGVVDTCDP